MPDKTTDKMLELLDEYDKLLRKGFQILDLDLDKVIDSIFSIFQAAAPGVGQAAEAVMRSDAENLANRIKDSTAARLVQATKNVNAASCLFYMGKGNEAGALMRGRR